MRKLLTLLTTALFASLAGAYALGSMSAGDLFIDFYIMLRETLGNFAVLLPILCLGLAAAILVFGWRSDSGQNHAWPEREDYGAGLLSAETAPGPNDGLYPPPSDADGQFSRYFDEKLTVRAEAPTREKKVYARLGENFNTYFGEGNSSLAPATRTVRVHGFHRYFSDPNYLVSRRKKRKTEQTREDAADVRSGIMSAYRRHEEKIHRRGSAAPEEERTPARAPLSVWHETPPPLALMTETGQAAAVPPPPLPEAKEAEREQTEPVPRQADKPALCIVAGGASSDREADWTHGKAAEKTGPDDSSALRAETGGPEQIRRPAPSATSYAPPQYTAPLSAAPRRQWVLPSLLLLDRPAIGRSAPDIVEPERLEEIFAGYGVSVSVNHGTVGPVVTQYEVVPQTGTKIRKIESLADDVALALASPGGVRIEMIPGRGAMGVEVPNKIADTVYFYQIAQSARFKERKSLLRIALGKDIANRPIVAELNRMPHLLVAGATGSGKSIFINCLINSILFSATPNEARLVLIDPKMVELSQYGGVPHLLAPVVTDAKKAVIALRFLVREMESRYELFARRKVRDIDGYNAALPPNEARLPYIVVIIDEMADLMMAASGDIEELVCRLAQMARAAGMHLVLATQRPSVNVITGLIKANIPARIAFSVSSQIDSRTIIDTAGAEKLLGRGDMLFLPVGLSRPLRVHGCYISEAEIRRVTEHWLRQGRPHYQIGEDELSEAESADSAQGSNQDSSADEKFFQAGMLIISAGKASATFLQTRLKVGYARAARLIDLLEVNGVIGPGEGSKPREILMSAERFQEFFE
jgi:DNA segregation ATPase FtsK/SpoIIIE-like protein